MKLRVFLCSILIALLAVGSVVYASAEGSDALPGEYCMRDEYIILAQNQDKQGYCWNFAATMAASTTIMKATGEYYDFSEAWLGISAYNTSSYNKPGAGGSFSTQYSALLAGGLMLESDLPYESANITSTENAGDYYNFFSQYANSALASTVVYTSADSSYSRKEVEDIKRHIYEHGSIYMTFTFRSGFIDNGDGSYYLTPNQTNTNSNHAVSVIGWDDNYEKTFYLNGSTEPTVFKGAWLILNSYTETSGTDGISLVFYDDNNIGSVMGYRYVNDTDKDLYFYDRIESGYSYVTNLKGKYYGDFKGESAVTKQKNIFYGNDVDLEYSYNISSGASVKGIDVYLDNVNVNKHLDITVDEARNRFRIKGDDLAYGQYKVIVTYGNGETLDTYLNNFYVTGGLVGEEVEYDNAKNDLGFNTGKDLDYYSFSTAIKNYVIYTNKLSGTVHFVPTETSVYSISNMSIPDISYEITDGVGCVRTYTITGADGCELTYTFNFEYCADTSREVVAVYYDLGGGVNDPNNYENELADLSGGLSLYAPTRDGYTFEGWYLDYGNGSKPLMRDGDKWIVEWGDICHLGESPNIYASSYYKQYYKNTGTLFVYAHWVEEEYYKVSVDTVGGGNVQISGDILISSQDSVRYIFTPDKGWCLSSLEINGERVSTDELIGIAKNGLRLEKVSEDTNITATFTEGVLVSIKYGENIKTAYFIIYYKGESYKFYNGDVIPASLFVSGTSANHPSTDLPTIDRPIDRPVIRPPLKDDVFNKDDIKIDNIIKEPILKGETESDGGVYATATASVVSYATFSLIVEVIDDADGYTYAPAGVSSYKVVERGVFSKNYSISKNGAIKEVTIDSAVKMELKQVNVTYTANDALIVDHYISADPNATSGSKLSIEATTGDVVYLFVKIPEDDAQYSYWLGSGFESVGDGWLRMMIFVDPDNSYVGKIIVYREVNYYTVRWVNWDGTVLYEEDFAYGTLPRFPNDSAITPKRPSDDEYSYVFKEWSPRMSIVTDNATYVAVYTKIERVYVISADSSSGGLIATNVKGGVHRGESWGFMFTPLEGYRVKDVIVDGVSVGAVSEYEFKNISADHTIFVEFELIKHSVNVTAVGGGKVDNPSFTVDYGTDAVINITPDERFVIESITVNGVAWEITEPITISSVKADCEVVINFKQIAFDIDVSVVGGGGTAKGGIVSLGKNRTVNFIASEGYKVKNVTVDGESLGAISSYTFEGVNASHTVTVEFELESFYINITKIGEGSVTADGSTESVVFGEGRVLTFTAADGWSIAGVTFGGYEVALEDGKLVIPSVMANVNIVVTFVTAESDSTSIGAIICVICAVISSGTSVAYALKRRKKEK